MSFRRSYERHNLNLWASLSVGNQSGASVFLKDLSSRGAGIRTNFPIDLGQLVQIQIREPFFGTPFIKSAKVVWSHQADRNLWNYGLDFGQVNLLEIPL